jgi:quercetin dioxygenase-like cupin family protein
MKRTIVLGAFISLLLAGIAVATPGSGVTPMTLASGTSAKYIKASVQPGTDVVVQDLIWTPGAYTGWHSHPGVVIVVVKTGALTVYRSDDGRCKSKTYSAGQTFAEYPTQVMNTRNEGSVVAEVVATFTGVPVGGLTRIDQPSPGTCPF